MAELGDIKSLSDAKLRSELQRLGFPAGPVTDSTRSILQKKLQKLRSEQKKPSKRASVGLPSRKVLGFSSDESENDTGPATGRQANTRRRSARGRLTTANRRNARATALEADNDSNDEENVDNNLPNARAFSFLNRDKSPKSQPNNVYNARPTEARPRPNVRPNLNKSGVGQARFPNHTLNDRARDKSSLNADKDTNDHLFTKPRPERNSSFFSRARLFGSQTNDNEFSDSDVDHEPTSKRSNRTDSSMSKGDNNSYDAKANASYSAKRNSNSPLRNSGGNKTFNVTPEGEENATEEAHRLRRRSSFNSTPKTSTPRKTTPHSLNRSEAGSFFGSSSDKKRLDGSLKSASANEMSSRGYGRQNSNSLLEQEFATEENLSSSLGSKYSHIISMVLLACAFIFFAVLGVLYISVGSEEVPNVIKDEKFLVCGRGDVCNGAKDEILKNFAEALYQLLSERAGLHQCGYLSEGEDQKMLKSDVIKYLEKEFQEQRSKSTYWVEDMLTEVLEQIVTKDLGIQLLKGDKEQITEEEDIELCHYLLSEHAAMPWLCRVRRSASLVLFRLAVIMLLVILSWLFVVYLRYYWRKQEEEREEVHHMVEKILDMLAKHHRACQNDSSKKTNNAYQAIPHVRDSIIPPAERQRMQRIWNKAVQFINTHESRVRVETQRIEGEEFQVWRWVQATLTPQHRNFAPVMELEYNPNRVKVWQGTAFDNPEEAVKMRSYSPTECLKIRNMFDISLESSENWEVVIEDAVMERCGPDNGIVHVAVDKTSTEGCVYVKFLSPAMAGQGFRKLHGSWFDGKLITVKFLRLERYHTRFPEAAHATTPIQPSNNLKKSLSVINRPSAGGEAT
ncbi:Inner nuclear membrane protein Man1 [Holothuria leucospilota]|uniref:LEM domain-containing protein 2 n=1 Tax=Holothuria leucospilota TaxID=206669 RepID=A0A9Q1CMW7_HOLLE|nr:Inner nuclear membrane protein Man1 [Holothuria leucospilota]